ncbi:hypothetical protein NDU88_002232 [Pleurodeles waltl]|uniref:Uncharacterized protein n=1 Tax=Pleurodeles waltl TaxID=8319 RepID=A0AAV7P6B5_PLEWA|nr:hypothetical protein NDU88_002232 [Pleurodeles waltl]
MAQTGSQETKRKRPPSSNHSLFAAPHAGSPTVTSCQNASIAIRLGLVSPGRKPWRFAIHRYRSPQGKLHLQDHAATYAQDNLGTVDSSRIMWAAAKAVIRAQLTKDAVLANKDRKEQQAELELHICWLTRLFTVRPSLPGHRNLERAQIALNELYTSQAEYALQRLQGRLYELGEKAGRLLAAQLRQRTAALAILAIRASSGEILTLPQAIANKFVSFYKHLYTPETTSSPAQMTAFLWKGRKEVVTKNWLWVEEDGLAPIPYVIVNVTNVIIRDSNRVPTTIE